MVEKAIKEDIMARTFERSQGNGSEPRIYVTEHPVSDVKFRVMYRQYGIQRCIQDDITNQAEAHAVREAVVKGLNEKYADPSVMTFARAQNIALEFEHV